jgi:hypothetical protein
MSLWCRKITNQPKSSQCQLRVFLKHLEVVCQPLGVGPVSTKEIWTQVCADAGEEHNAQPSVQLLNGLVSFLGRRLSWSSHIWKVSLLCFSGPRMNNPQSGSCPYTCWFQELELLKWLCWKSRKLLKFTGKIWILATSIWLGWS